MLKKSLMVLLFISNFSIAAETDMATRLGVTMPQLLTCIKDNRPTTTPTDMGKQKLTMKAKMVPCLQKYNKNLTPEQYDVVMFEFEPPMPPIGPNKNSIPPK